MRDVMSFLWEHDELEIESLEDFSVPAWIDKNIDCCQVAAILQGGCASGAYMPAVTYHKASDMMAQYGDDVLEYIDNAGMLDSFEFDTSTSWSGIAVTFLSMAVELWASGIESQLDGMDEEEILANVEVPA